MIDLKSLNLSNKQDELKQFEGIFLQTLMNDLIRTKLKEIVNLQDTIKTDELHYRNVKKIIISVKSLYLLLFKEIYIKEDADEEQSNLACKLKNLDKLKKS